MFVVLLSNRIENNLCLYVVLIIVRDKVGFVLNSHLEYLSSDFVVSQGYNKLLFCF